ncbi:MAG: hypothetical protein ACE5HI_16845 [bacterium]
MPKETKVQITDSERLQALLDQYKDSFKYLTGYLKTRERLFLIVLIVVVGMFLDFTAIVDSSSVVSQIAKKSLGVKVILSPKIVSTMFWFVLLSTVVRYFQATILVERQYPYIHQLEKEISVIAGDSFHREGRAYLENYPFFSKWTWALYTIVFPAILSLAAIVKAYNEFQIRDILAANYYLNCVFFLMLLVSIVLYIMQIHFKK